MTPFIAFRPRYVQSGTQTRVFSGALPTEDREAVDQTTLEAGCFGPLIIFWGEKIRVFREMLDLYRKLEDDWHPERGQIGVVVSDVDPQFGISMPLICCDYCGHSSSPLVALTGRLDPPYPAVEVPLSALQEAERLAAELLDTTSEAAA